MNVDAHQSPQKAVAQAVPTFHDAVRLDRRDVAAGRSMVLFGLVSLCVTMLYAHFCFVPYVHEMADTYDAFRYHKFAEQAAAFGPFDGLQVEIPFQQPGYPRFLTVVYALFGPSAYLGCAINWLMWLLAGLVLVPLVQRPDEDDPLLRRIFLVAWLLLPDAIDWCGTTSKEPLVALFGALGARAALEVGRAVPRRAILWLGVLVLLFVGSFEVRSALAPILAVGGLLGVLSRPSQSPFVQKIVSRLSIVAMGAGYIVIGQDPKWFGQESMKTGFEHMQQFEENLSSNSVLRLLGSENRYVDVFVTPIRGLAHLVSPLWSPPWELPVAQVADISLILWVSAGIYVVLLGAITLRALDGDGALPGTGSRLRTLTYAVIAGTLVLGFSGLIHERYRSTLIGPLMVLGVQQLYHEVRQRGWARLLVVGVNALLFALLAYGVAKTVR
jgi:xanthosine utilization system XapX-like protein